MSKITPKDVTATKSFPSGAWIVSIVRDGYRQARVYYGYSKREAIRLFIAEVSK